MGFAAKLFCKKVGVADAWCLPFPQKSNWVLSIRACQIAQLWNCHPGDGCFRHCRLVVDRWRICQRQRLVVFLHDFHVSKKSSTFVLCDWYLVLRRAFPKRLERRTVWIGLSDWIACAAPNRADFASRWNLIKRLWGKYIGWEHSRKCRCEKEEVEENRNDAKMRIITVWFCLQRFDRPGRGIGYKSWGGESWKTCA